MSLNAIFAPRPLPPPPPPHPHHVYIFSLEAWENAIFELRSERTNVMCFCPEPGTRGRTESDTDVHEGTDVVSGPESSVLRKGVPGGFPRRRLL